MKRLFSLILLCALLLPLLPVRAAASGTKLAALTFDDGPDPRDTPLLLDGLAARGVKVTFFVQGERVGWYPSVARRAYEEGHELASHSWDHPELTELTDEQIRAQFAQSYALMDEICGSGTEYLVRPPYGSTNSRVRETIARPLIHWSVDTLDWQSLNEYDVRDAILRDTYDGAIILLHDIHRTSVYGVLMAIDIMLEEGWEFVTVSELYRRRGVALENGKTYYHCRPTGTDLGSIVQPSFDCRETASGTEITIASPSGAPVYYTTDGSYPNGTSTLYTGPFTVTDHTSVRAVAAWKLNGSRSETVSPRLSDFPCEAPQLRVEGGVMTLHHEKENVELHYTLDGTPATMESPLYTGPVAIPSGTTIHAVAGNPYRPSQQTVRHLSQRGILSADLEPGAWYFDAMDDLAERGLLNGVGGDRFAPQNALTRGMLVTLLYRCSGETLGQWSQQSGFADVDPAMYYAEAVEWAWRGGMVNGYSDTEFRPDGPITREELCCIIQRYLTRQGTPLPSGAGTAQQYPDHESIHDWAVESVESMTASGLIQGTGRGMEPAGQATRAQVAVILVRMMTYQEAQQA